MTRKQPPDRYKFDGVWDEISYLHDKLLYWLYQRSNPARARPYVKRLEQLLQEADPGHDAILGSECWSLIHEAKGNLQQAIEHRENEIRLIRQLHEQSRGKPYEEAALGGYDYTDWADRLDLLATLYRDKGELDKAVTALAESKRLCEEHGLPFDGEDLLEEYQEEKRVRECTGSA